MLLDQPIDRRTFLRTTAAGLAASTLSLRPRLLSAATQTVPAQRSIGELQAAIRGPILSVPTPFTADFDVDYDGVRRMIRRALDHGIRVFSLTAGNSYYHALTYDEIKELTRVTAESVGDDGVMIASTGKWWTGQAVDYARFAESAGADAVQVLLPTRTDMAGQVEHFRAIADAAPLGIVLHGQYSPALLEELVEIDQIIAMKEDATLVDYIAKQRKFGDRLVIFAGGPKYRFLVARPYGAQAFYTLYGTFAPQVPMRFWEAVQADDMDAAYEIVKTYEHPFFDRWSHAFWRASLEHFGVAQRYLRPPEKSFTDEQMIDVKQFFDRLNLHPPA